MDPEDRGRYEIRDNVLIIRNVRRDRDEGMYQVRRPSDNLWTLLVHILYN